MLRMCEIKCTSFGDRMQPSRAQFLKEFLFCVVHGYNVKYFETAGGDARQSLICFRFKSTEMCASCVM